RAALPRAQRPGPGPVAVASPAPRDAAQPHPPPGLRGRLHLGPPRRGSAAAGAGAPRSRAGRARPAGLRRVPAGQSRRVHLLGAIPEPSPAAAPATATGTAAGSGAADGVVAGRVGGLRPLRMPHADALHPGLALRLPAARLGLWYAAVSKPQW